VADLVLINQSALITPPELVAAVAAFNTQISRDFAPVWGTPGTVYFGEAPGDAWKVYLQDGLDQPGDLGYHLDDAGNPEARIDIQGSVNAGDDWRTVVSHELLETLADPLTTRMGSDGITIVEVCDPVEETLYLIDGLVVSNFVLPAYFGLEAGTKYDFNGQLTAPAPTLLPGGYLMQFLGGQWVSHFGRKADGTLSFMATRSTGRSTYRASKPPR
jgi:hypothetical protein